MLRGGCLFVEPVVEDLDGGGLVDDLLLLPGVLSGAAEFLGGGDGAEAFVGVVEGEVGETGTELRSEGADLCRGVAFRAVHAEGEAEDEVLDAALRDDLGDAFEGIPGVTVDGFDRMGGDAERIGGGKADPGGAVVDGEDGMEGMRNAEWGVWNLRGRAEVREVPRGAWRRPF